jgi:hypothetical protein
MMDPVISLAQIQYALREGVLFARSVSPSAQLFCDADESEAKFVISDQEQKLVICVVQFRHDGEDSSEVPYFRIEGKL